MNAQSLIAIAVVLLCAAIVLRSWIRFWVGLIWPSADAKQINTSCRGCVNGCQNGSSTPKIVELKREI